MSQELKWNMHQQHPVNSQRTATSKPSPLQSKGSFNSCPHNHSIALVGHHHEKHCKLTTQHQSSPPQCSYLWQESNQMFFPSKVQQCYCSVPNEYHQAVQDYLPCHPNSAFVSVNPSYQKRILLNNDATPNVVAYKSQCPTHFSNTQQPCSVQSHQIQHNQVSPHYHQQIQHQHFHQQPQFVVHNVSNAPQVQLQKQGVTCACHSKNNHRHMLQPQMSLQANTHYQQYHYRLFQKRPMDEGEKLKRSRDGWDYELSQDLQAKQVEMLKRKYGGEAKSNRAARIIQQAYRRYSLDKNFAKLKLEVDKRRLSRRFNEAGRSKTIWMEACPNGSPYADHASSGNYAQMRIPSHGRAEYSRDKSKWVSPEYYPQNIHGMAITTTTISEERTVRKEEKTIVLPVFEQPDSRNYEEYNAVKKLDSRVAPVHHHHHMHHSEHSAVSKGSSFCLPQYPVGSYDQISNETYPMLQQESSGMDNGVDFDTDMVAELPPTEDTMDDEMYDQHFIQSDTSHEELQKGGEAVFNLVSSHERRPQGPSELENAGYAMVNLRSCNSLRRGEVKNGSEVKSFSSPVWKRKMVGGRDGLEEHSSVACRETELPIVPQASYITHAPPHSKPDLTRFGHHSNLPSKPRVSDKQRKRTYRIGLNLFNKKPEKGICYLIERHFLDNRPSAVARFLIARKGLSKQMIGEYLGNLQKQFNMEVLRCFAEEIDLTGLQVDVALRKFQSFFRMPGEAQKIERLMEAFASHYCHCNPDVVKSFNRPDTVFLLAFATIMLNTDLHNKSIKSDRKMKLEDFIKNLRGIDDGEDVNAELLSGIYERIKVSEFVPGSDHVSQVAKVEQMIVGKKPQLAELHRRLVCYCRLYEVQDPNRKEKFGLHQREVFLFNDMIMVTKIIGKKKNSVTYSFRCTFSLSGMTVYLFESQYYRHGIRLTNGSNGKSTIMLNARNEHDRSKFVEDLKEAILEMNEMESLRIEEELIKQQIMKQKHCNYNRHSKDSGVVDIELLRPSDFGGNRLSTAVDGSARVSSSPSLPDVVEYVHRGSAGSLDSGLVSIHT